ncbi:maleylpyruvate isomerase family mycothiol-dependent enzyme [Saccharopolyspora griseoalba]|uniref:Maleylpyruvate isomerase family mycothiol-dependent enzyme n=1 Tax=Saccharopolyspora griseoalba TaxID=1431848 RepID=A0ABW2LKA8_9PSEU
MPPLKAVADGHRRLLEVTAPLTDEQVRAPSLLPGWSRGHVLAHLTDNARAFARVCALALRGELVDAHEGGQAERDAIIEGLATGNARAHRDGLARHIAALEAVWSQASPADWELPVRFRNGELADVVRMRWREVWIHLVDLDLGVTAEEWTEEFSHHAIEFLLPRLPEGVALRQTDGPARWSADGEISAVQDVEITGRARDLAAWLSGRTPQRLPAGDLPELGPWPAHPAPTPDRARQAAG